MYGFQTLGLIQLYILIFEGRLYINSMLVQYVIVFVSFFQSNDYIDIKIRICEEFCK